jgi:hypothetical protein
LVLLRGDNVPRIVKVGAGGDEIDWKEALKTLRADDMLLLKPGFYELEQGISACDVTIKGTGASPEDTIIDGYISVSPDSRYVTLENLTINTVGEKNAIFIPYNADTYLTLRNCFIKTEINENAALALNGKCTVELYSSRIVNGSVSFFSGSDFRLEMNDSKIDYPVTNYCGLALEGIGTAIINNSIIDSSLNTFSDTNIELVVNNSRLRDVHLAGQTWLNMLNCQVYSKDDNAFTSDDECWLNITNSVFTGGMYLDGATTMLLQNSHCDRLMAIADTKTTMTNSLCKSHADFQQSAKCDATRSTFNGSEEFEFFLAVNGEAEFKGHDIVLNPNGATLAVQDNATFRSNVLASDQKALSVEYTNLPNVNILGLKWEKRK